ncbi:MAG TPA: ribosome biogenesis GTPase YlqF [Rhodocyclaceae bacterium]|nr:ribosome biogenesis GTPase YlqF [Rhodocyclaceae bacterium]
MPIQWFPGHMVAARKKTAEVMERTDVVIEVLDARLPMASSNPMIDELRRFRQRPCLKLLNKIDLADPNATKQWLDYFNAQPGVKAIGISAKKNGDVTRIPNLCQSLAPHRNDGVKPLRMMIMGIPNVGKSTLMNTLLKRRVAAVGDEPAVTKSVQSLEINTRMTLTDTPGMMWPKIQHDSDGFMLAIAHAIGRNAVIEEQVGAFLGELLLARYPQLLTARYGFATEGMDGIGVVEAVARKRNARHTGKGRKDEYDLEKAAMLFLTDFRDGILGRISLETPETRSAMLATAAEKAANTAKPVAADIHTVDDVE